MNTLLKQIDYEYFYINNKVRFSTETVLKCRSSFDTLKSENKIKGTFDDDKWMIYTGLKWNGVIFTFNKDKYYTHLYKYIQLDPDELKIMLKCFAMYCYGEYIAYSIAGNIRAIIKAIETLGEAEFKLMQSEHIALEQFFHFIEMDNMVITKIMQRIKIVKRNDKNIRELKPVINYLAIQDAVLELYSSNIDEEKFIKWFPIFFWTNITFIVPLRATEMMVTPLNCIKRKDDKVYLVVRRTKLKGKKTTQQVSYDVEKDYQLFEHHIPDIEVVKVIERYIEITKRQNRNYLFTYESHMINEMLSLRAFNNLLASFIDEYIIGNSKYDYARYASGINEFEYVTAGDSRPIAMVNMYYSKVGIDIIKQLANHSNVSTSFGYFSNVDEIIEASSIIQFQRRIKNSEVIMNDWIKENTENVQSIENCKSFKKAKGDFSDCDKHHPYDECMGCDKHDPDMTEIEEYLERYKEPTNTASKKAIECFNNLLKMKKMDVTITELFYDVQMNIIRYKTGTDMKAKEKFLQWQDTQSTMKIYS